MAIVKIAKVLESRGISFDKHEGYRLLCFLKMSGQYPVDQSPIFITPKRADDGVFGLFQGYPTSWTVSTLATLKPMLLPNKTALAMATNNRLLIECGEAARSLGLPVEDAKLIVSQVIQGMKEWSRIADDHNLDGYERWGFCPAVVNSNERVGLANKPELRRGNW